MGSIITVENLSKRFILKHEQQERYVALRDVIANKAQSVFRSFSRKDVSTEEFYALEDVSIDIKKGERIGIIGRNGAGKSTLLKILSRITEPSSGKITIGGRVASLLEVGTGFHPELTGRENVYLNGAILGMSRAEIRRKFDEIVDFAEVEKFLDTPVKRYSSGMYVRLAFAVAAHLEPEILIVDEVLAVGDAQFQKKCLGKMEGVSKNEGRTVLFVSHNTGVIAQLCNNIIWLDHGKVREVGNAKTVLSNYSKFLGSNTSSVYNKSNVAENAILSCKLYAQDMVTTTLMFNEDIRLNITVRINHERAGLKLGMAVLNDIKQKLFTSHFELESFAKSDHNELEINCIIPKDTLVPGRYSFDVALFRDGGIVYDYVKDICSFEILDSGFEMSGYADFGFINIPCTWETSN